MAVLERDDGKIFYSVQGSGETLLMLRDLGRSSRYWLGFDKVMAADFQVVTIDMRGLGRSTQPMAWTDDMGTLAEDCLAVLDHLKIKKFHIYGLSFGGMVATEIAALEPKRVLSLMVSGTSTADFNVFRIHPTVLPKLLLALRNGHFQDTLLETLVPSLVLRSWGPEIQAAWQEILAKEGFPLVTTLKQLRIGVGHRIKDRLKGSQFPTLFIHGSMDGFVPLKNSLRLQRLIPGSAFKVIKGAGHDIALGFEHEVRKVLREFVESPNKA